MAIEVTTVLPANEARAAIYRGKNFNELKFLSPDGSVISGMPVVITGTIPMPTATKYALRLDTTSYSGIMYIGEAATGSLETVPVWRIQKIDLTPMLIIKWASGNADFSNKWSDRLTLSYL